MSPSVSNAVSAPWDLDVRVASLDRSFHPGVKREEFAHIGRLQLIALLRRGLTPDSPVIDVGCGGLRAGYWLIHFLDRGRYHGIEPRQSSVDTARAQLLEPGLEDAKAPRFDYNGDFDLSVFGIAPRFVLARSIWTHTAKSQIEALLDSFAAVAAPDALLLASYIPAASPGSERRSDRLMARLQSLARRNGAPRPHKAHRRDYQGTGWAGHTPLATDKTHKVIAHRFDWIADQCTRRGLSVKQSSEDNFGGQTWLEVRRSVSTGGGRVAAT
jgi:hypothetical protein